MWNLWVWEQPSWRVLASYAERVEAEAAARYMADPEDTWTITKAGMMRDNYLREHCTERAAGVKGGAS